MMAAPRRSHVLQRVVMVTAATGVPAESVAANLRIILYHAMTLPDSTIIRFPTYMPPTNF